MHGQRSRRAQLTRAQILELGLGGQGKGPGERQGRVHWTRYHQGGCTGHDTIRARARASDRAANRGTSVSPMMDLSVLGLGSELDGHGGTGPGSWFGLRSCLGLSRVRSRVYIRVRVGAMVRG